MKMKFYLIVLSLLAVCLWGTGDVRAQSASRSMTVTGKVVPSYKDPTTPEVQAIAIHLEGDCPEDYPLQP